MTIDAATLRLDYPAFAAVSDEYINRALERAALIVTEAWGADQEPGTLALAAHYMALARTPGIADGGASELPAGVTSFRSASVQVSVTEAAANRAVTGGYGSTPYGVEFDAILRRNVGGPLLVGYVEPCLGWPGVL